MIAIAGPAVNVAIAGVLFVVNEIVGTNVSLFEAMNTQANVLGLLMWINLGLVVFNMMPAFPMDGGRVFRAALATQMEYRVATHIAALAGQAIAVVFAIYGIMNGMWTLPFVAVFVFIAARQEVQHVMERT
jgi:stage IV sporulation protein FB